MSSLKKEEKKTLENALFHALKSHGLISPINNENTEQAEEIGTESTVIALPAEFADAQKFIKKKAKTIKLVPDHTTQGSRSYAKVAFKKATKRKGK